MTKYGCFFSGVAPWLWKPLETFGNLWKPPRISKSLKESSNWVWNHKTSNTLGIIPRIVYAAKSSPWWCSDKSGGFPNFHWKSWDEVTYLISWMIHQVWFHRDQMGYSGDNHMIMDSFEMDYNGFSNEILEPDNLPSGKHRKNDWKIEAMAQSK